MNNLDIVETYMEYKKGPNIVNYSTLYTIGLLNGLYSIEIFY